MAARPLKIGIIIDASLDPYDGVQQYVLRLGEWLTKDGHEVHYLVGETHERQLANIHSLSKNLNVKFNGNRVSMPLWTSRRKVKKLLKELQLDVLHVQMPHHPLMAQIILLNADKRVARVGTFHILPITKLVALSTKLLGYLLRPSLKQLDEILAVSSPAKAFVDKSFGVESTVLSNVVDLKWFRKSISSKNSNKSKLKIVFLGRLVERKGAMQLLEAVAALPKDTLNRTEVIIGGRGPLLPQLESYVAQARLNDIVTFSGFVDEADKPAFLHQADIAVFPSTGGESFGIVLLEAMAAGSGVVIGGNNAGYASVLAPFPETLFDPNDGSMFSKKLQTLIDNNTSRQKIHNAQQKYVEMFDVAVVGPKLVGRYENAIAKRARRQDNKL